MAVIISQIYAEFNYFEIDSTALSSYDRQADGGILQTRVCSVTLRVRSHEVCLRVAYILLEPGHGACFCRRWGPGW